MHEQSIAKAVIEEAVKHGKVVGIVVEVGDLAHLPANEMEDVLKTMTKWKVKVIRKQAVIHCEKCGFKGAPEILEKGHDHNVFRCPKCRMMMPKIIDGEQIILKEVEVK